MTITKLEAREVFKNVTENNEDTKIIKIGKHIKIVEAKHDNWEYKFMFHDDVLKKIEEYNHRELIEVTVQ